MIGFLFKHKIKILLFVFILAYIVYFSYFTILRYQTLYASHYDLGIMNQTVYNTYKAIANHDLSRILELTDPTNGQQIKRMAIHNDVLLAFLAPFYFIHAGPETLLVIQSIVLGLGALAIFGIAAHVFQKKKYASVLALLFSVAYLLYTPMQRSNDFDFHAVTLATSFLLFMFYFWLKKRYKISLLFFLLSLLSKEQVGLTAFMFGLYTLYINRKNQEKRKENTIYAVLIMLVSVVWVIVSFGIITPLFRGSKHFAIGDYGDFGDSPIRIIIGIITNPYSVSKYIFRNDTLRYFWFLLGPVGFLSLLSPLQLLISVPEFAINLLSNDWNMRNIVFHYTAVIQPFIFIASVYGAEKLLQSKTRLRNPKLIGLVLIGATLLFSYFKGPLPFTREQDIHPFKYPQQAAKEVQFWAKVLNDESYKIAATGQVAPHFSSRRYIYLFSNTYVKADYVVIRRDEIYNYPEKDVLIPMYEKLTKDPQFEKIYEGKSLEVFRKVTNKDGIIAPTY